MKLTNRQNNNYIDFDECIFRGIIEMNKIEFLEAFKFLEKEYKKAKKNCDTYTRDALFSKFSNNKIDKEKKIVNLGITATKLIVKKYNLKNYKDVNYLIKIKKNV